MPKTSRPSRRAARRLPSAGSIIVLAATVLATVTLAPTIQQFVAQRQRIAELDASISDAQDRIDALQIEQARWADPAYVEAQARGRLLFIRPGDTLYLVEGGAAPAAATRVDVAAQQHATEHDWLEIAATSIIVAGTSTDPSAGGAQ